MRTWVVLAALTAFSGALAWAENAPPGPDRVAAVNAEVRSRLSAYLDAFNDGDAEAVGAFWAEAAVSRDDETGDQTVGREAITADFREFFAESPGARLTGEVDEVRSVSPDVAIAEGTVDLSTPGSEPEPSEFTAVLVKEDGVWQIESSYERALANPSPRTALEELQWLIGEWRDDTDEVDVLTTVRWSPNEAFLIRSFSVDYADGESFEGTQVIGWDTQAKQFRTWTFHSDGSFGEGVVSRRGDQWLIDLSHTRSDGSLSTGTQILELVDEDTLQVERIGQTVDGTPVVSGEPVIVRRVVPTEQSTVAEEASR